MSDTISDGLDMSQTPERQSILKELGKLSSTLDGLTTQQESVLRALEDLQTTARGLHWTLDDLQKSVRELHRKRSILVKRLAELENVDLAHTA